MGQDHSWMIPDSRMVINHRKTHSDNDDTWSRSVRLNKNNERTDLYKAFLSVCCHNSVQPGFGFRLQAKMLSRFHGRTQKQNTVRSSMTQSPSILQAHAWHSPRMCCQELLSSLSLSGSISISTGVLLSALGQKNTWMNCCLPSTTAFCSLSVKCSEWPL